jgi:hypothetical protein
MSQQNELSTHSSRSPSWAEADMTHRTSDHARLDATCLGHPGGFDNGLSHRGGDPLE